MRLAVIFILFFLSPVFSSEKIRMTIAYEDKEQPPYYMGNTSEVLPANPGAAVEMVRLLEKKIPLLEIKFVRYPWKRCLASLGDNTVDGIFNSSYKEDRLNIGWYPTTDRTHRGKPDFKRRLCSIKYSLYTLKGTSTGWDGKTFRNFSGTVTAPLGYSIVDDLHKLGVKIEEAPTTVNNLDKVLNGRVEAAALQDVTADSIINKNKSKYGNIIKASPPLSDKHYYLMLSKKFVMTYPDTSQKIWDELAKIREDQLDKISSRYAALEK